MSCLIVLLLLKKLTYQKQTGGFKVLGGIFFFCLLFSSEPVSFNVISEANPQISKIRYTPPLIIPLRSAKINF